MDEEAAETERLRVMIEDLGGMAAQLGSEDRRFRLNLYDDCLARVDLLEKLREKVSGGQRPLKADFDF